MYGTARREFFRVKNQKPRMVMSSLVAAVTPVRASRTGAVFRLSTHVAPGVAPWMVTSTSVTVWMEAGTGTGTV